MNPPATCIRYASRYYFYLCVRVLALDPGIEAPVTVGQASTGGECMFYGLSLSIFSLFVVGSTIKYYLFWRTKFYAF